MIIICTSGQIAIWTKKHVEHKRDQVQLVQITPIRHFQDKWNHGLEPDEPHLRNESDQNPKSIKINKKLLKINNQKWNEHFCSNSGIILLLIIVFLIGSCATILQWVVFNGSDLTEELKTQFKYHILQLISTVLIPIFIYLKHGKLYKHVKTEILG